MKLSLLPLSNKIFTSCPLIVLVNLRVLGSEEEFIAFSASLEVEMSVDIEFSTLKTKSAVSGLSYLEGP